MITVYQNNSVKKNSDLLNRLGWDGASKANEGIKAHLETSHGFGDDINWTPEWFKYYDKVANVKSKDLEDTFRVLNLWNEPERVQNIAPMHSLSVGDILKRDGVHYIVAGCGFQQIEV